MSHLRLISVSMFLGLSMAYCMAVVAADATPNPATTPSPRPDDWWKERQESVNRRVKDGNVDMIFIGDSITHGWEGSGKEFWAKYYAKRNAANLGFSGDQTCHVLWRLDHGNIDGIAPKLAVIMIGTNNAGHTPHQSPEQIYDGVKAIIDRLEKKLPDTKILLLAIFPRGEKPDDEIRQINTKANAMIEKLADNKTVYFLDIGPKFLKADGTLPSDIMPDMLHPNAKGYQIWAESMEPKVKELMGEK